jgi:hypothetical protein
VKLYFFRRSIELRAGVAEYIVYVVRPVDDGSRPDPVPVIAAFPAGWVPTDFPGQCLFDRDAPARVYETFVPRSQFRHYSRIAEAEAVALFPMLREQQLQRAQWLPAKPFEPGNANPR